MLAVTLSDHVNYGDILSNHLTNILLKYFAGEKPLRMNQISKKVNPLRSNYCVLTRIVFCGFYCCTLINPRKVRKCLMLAKHSSNTEYCIQQLFYTVRCSYNSCR